MSPSQAVLRKSKWCKHGRRQGNGVNRFGGRRSVGRSPSDDTENQWPAAGRRLPPTAGLKRMRGAAKSGNDSREGPPRPGSIHTRGSHLVREVAATLVAVSGCAVNSERQGGRLNWTGAHAFAGTLCAERTVQSNKAPRMSRMAKRNVATWDNRCHETGRRCSLRRKASASIAGRHCCRRSKACLDSRGRT